MELSAEARKAFADLGRQGGEKTKKRGVAYYKMIRQLGIEKAKFRKNLQKKASLSDKGVVDKSQEAPFFG